MNFICLYGLVSLFNIQNLWSKKKILSIMRGFYYLFIQDEGEGEAEFEGDGETEGQGEIEVESEPEVHDVDPEQADSEGERAQSSPERGISEQKVESGEKDAESEEEGYGQRVVTSRRREVIASESEGSDENQYADNDHEDEEVDQTRTQR